MKLKTQPVIVLQADTLVMSDTDPYVPAAGKHAAFHPSICILFAADICICFGALAKR